MKHALLFAAILAVPKACLAQVSAPDPNQPTNIYQSIIKETRVFSSLPDTANATAAAVLAPGTRVYVFIYATPRWVVCSQGNGRYYVPTASLGPPEQKEVNIPSTGGGGDVLTGPRGGRYRINSKGSKTYIKH